MIFDLVGGFKHFLCFHFIYGMSSETHWRTPSFSRRLKPPTRNDPSFARSLSRICHGMKVLAAVDTFLPTSADLSSIFRGSKLCPNKWYKPFPNGWLIIVLAPLCCLVKSLFLTVQSPCENSVTEVWSSQLSINLQLFQSLHLRGTQGDPMGDPA